MRKIIIKFTKKYIENYIFMLSLGQFEWKALHNPEMSKNLRGVPLIVYLILKLTQFLSINTFKFNLIEMEDQQRNPTLTCHNYDC
jgi:hypothetical protein